MIQGPSDDPHSSNITLAFNTIISPASAWYEVEVNDPGATGISLSNNVFVGKKSGFPALNIGIPTSAASLSHNLYFSQGTTNAITWNGKDYTLAALAGIGQEAGGISGDPLFVSASAGNYHLQTGSPAIGKGVPVPCVTDDLDGKARSSRPTLGAFE